MKYGTMALAVLAASCAAPAGVTRTVNPASPIPIATTVTAPPGSTLVFLSGVLPAVADPSAPAGSTQLYGSTETQAASVLSRLQGVLAAENLTFADVVSLRVFLVGDPANGGRMDFAGMNAAFARHFGTEAQPNRPARTVVQVSALPAPGALVEIDLIAARAPAAR